MSVFTLERPTQGAIPVLVEVPHAGLHIPEGVADQIAAPRDALLRDADLYVDRLYEGAPGLGAAMLVALNSRYVVDLNRSKDDVDRATVADHPAVSATSQPRGVVWRSTTDGRPILTQPLTYESLRLRLAAYYTPYHEALSESLVELRDRFGFAILLAAHSMPSTGRSLHQDVGIRRADVVPGTRGRSTADGRVIDLVDAHFRQAGLDVRHDEPYKGGFTTGHYGRPTEGWHAIQIELNRALYVDESNAEPREEGVAYLQQLLNALVSKLGELKL